MMKIAFLAAFYVSANEAFSDPYFYISEGSSRCFVENTPTYLPITITHRSYGETDVKCNLRIVSPSGETVLEKELPLKKGKTTYLTNEAGQYQLCVACPTSKWFSQSTVKWTFSVDLGDGDVALDDAAKGYDVISNDKVVKSLSRRVTNMLNESMYNTKLHKDIAKKTSALNKRIKTLTLLQLVVFGVTNVMVVSSLRDHFRKENLVN